MCALDIQKNSCVYHLEDLTLSCHIGISAGACAHQCSCGVVVSRIGCKLLLLPVALSLSPVAPVGSVGGAV